MNLKRLFLIYFVAVAGMTACTPVLTPTPVVPIKIQYTFATQPWLSDIQDCAGDGILDAEKRAVDFQDIALADLLLRVGDSGTMGEAFQIGTEEIVVIAHPGNPVNSLTANQVQRIFSGLARNWSDVGGDDLSIQVWVFAAGEDIQRIFLASGLSGTPITTFALQAASPEMMLEAIAADQSSIGLITGSGLTGGVRSLYSLKGIPVFALTAEEAPETVSEIIACLQE